jgi:hypothetical protein
MVVGGLMLIYGIAVSLPMNGFSSPTPEALLGGIGVLVFVF